MTTIESISAAGARNIRHGCLINVATLQELGIPAHGFGSLQHESLLNGKRAFVKCVPHDAVPVGHIVLQSWITSNPGYSEGSVVHLLKADSPDVPSKRENNLALSPKRNLQSGKAN